jgi:hypothetical protein
MTYGKRQAKLSLCLNTTSWRCIWGVEVNLHVFQTLALDKSDTIDSYQGEKSHYPTDTFIPR